MGEYVNVVAVNTVEVTPKDGQLSVFKRGDPPFMISNADFAELGPEGLKAVRRVKRDVLDHDNSGGAGGAVRLTPKHKGGGKFVVVDKNDATVSGDELFDDREQAQKWIDAGSYQGQ